MPAPIRRKTVEFYMATKGWSWTRLHKISGVGKSACHALRKSEGIHKCCGEVPLKLATALGVSVEQLGEEIADHEVVIVDGPFTPINLIYFRQEFEQGRMCMRYVGTNLADPPPDCEVMVAVDPVSSGPEVLPPIKWQLRGDGDAATDDLNSVTRARVQRNLARYRAKIAAS